MATVALGLSGCASLNQGVPAGALQANVYTNQSANVQVGQKVTADSSANVIFGFITLSEDSKFADGVSYAGQGALNLLDTTGAVKSAAAYKAMKSSGADVLVAPTYITEIEDFFVFKKVKVTVSAYKGTIKGFTQK
ncbi:MAG: hypothetical protein PHE89_02040 [Alphaproteobacteria bacterium]|nr:hypothetical protein [Alphaproteobacteria bacterium]